MIFDEKKNLDFYRNLGIEGRYAKAVDFLQNTDLEALEPRRLNIRHMSITPISST